LRLRLALFRWVYVPALVVGLVLMIVALPLGLGDSTLVFGGALTLAGAVTGLVTALRNLKTEIGELEEEQASFSQLLGEADEGRTGIEGVSAVES